MMATVALPGRTLEVHGGTRGVTLTVTSEEQAAEYLTLPDLDALDATIRALCRARTAIVMRAVAEERP